MQLFFGNKKHPVQYLPYHLQSTNVLSQYHSWPESLLTDIARQRDSLQMVCFNVVSDGYSCTFFSTDFAKVTSLSSIGDQVLAFLHHRLHFFIQFLQISWYLIRNYYPSFNIHLFTWLQCILLWPQIWFNWFGIQIWFLPLKLGLGFICWGIGSISFSASSICPINPFNLSSSAMARNESRFSWKTFASPQ